MTVAWMLLIAERAAAPDLDWPSFAANHPELFARPPLLTHYYPDTTLCSERGRRQFVMPDRCG